MNKIDEAEYTREIVSCCTEAVILPHAVVPLSFTHCPASQAIW
jgi:hypothetical protein